MAEHTIYRITAEADSYGPDCADPVACAEAIRDKLVKFANMNDYDIEFEIVDETESFGNRSTGASDIIAELNVMIMFNWADWVPATAYSH